jgi:phosphatidylglycerophosphatase A
VKTIFTFLGTGFGVGYTPFLPGTAGTLLGIVIYLFLSRIFTRPFSYVVMLVIFSGFGVWICGKCDHRLGKKDSPTIVIDEIGGFLVTMFALPVSFRFIFLGFILFRAFDILKPFKIEKLERLPGGWGIMIDDIAAGVLANLMLHIARVMLGW